MNGVAIEIGPFSIRWYAILINLGIIIAIFLSRYEAKRNNLNPDDLIDILIFALPAGIIGARLYYVAFNLSYYLNYPNEIFKIWHGGLAIHGGLIFGIFVGYIYTKIKRIDFLSWVDVVAPGIAIAQSIGRWGNFINKEAYGYATNLPWAIYVDGAYRHPTFLYESLWNIGVAVLLLYFLHKKYDYKGQIITSYAVMYSLGRFWIEGLRTDSLMFGNFRVAQLISVLIIIASIGLKYILKRKESK
jgi:phosphatidylglycerol:prolipoprotein diacylglycerol transferase